MTNDTTLILPDPSKTIRGTMKSPVAKIKATGRDGMRFYCDDPLLNKWRAEQWLGDNFSVGFGHDPASARADLINQRNMTVTA